MGAREEKSLGPRILDAGIIAGLFIFAFAAPHSIAAAQASWLLGMVLWLLRFAFHPRPKLYRTPIDYLLLGFFILTGLSAVLSYEPMVSIGKLRAASLFTIIYLFAENVPSLRVVRLLTITLIASCMINVIYTAGERLLGRGVKVYGVMETSVLYKAGVRDGDTLLALDGQKLNEPEEIVNALSRPEKRPAELKIYRHEWQPTFKVPRGDLSQAGNALEQLGVRSWSRGRDWRASGFFGHYVTYAEVLQLVIALTLGLFVSTPNKRSWSAGAAAGCISRILFRVTDDGHARRMARLSRLVFDNSCLNDSTSNTDHHRRSGCAACVCRSIPASTKTQRCFFGQSRCFDYLATDRLARRVRSSPEQAATLADWRRDGFDQGPLARVGTF